MKEHNQRVRLNRGCQTVLQTLEQMKGLTSAQEIHLWLKGNDTEGPGLTTIYRSLETLVGLGLVQAVDLGNGQKSFEAVNPGEHHHHLVCERCHVSIHLDQCFITSLDQAVLAKHGFHVESHVMEIFGICRKCQGKQQTVT